MKKNLYFRTMYTRTNPFKEFLSDTLYKMCSYPRLLLEVFIRKNFGERYFSFPVAMSIFFLMLILPFAEMITPWSYFHPSFTDVMIKNFTWYAFLGIYFAQCVRRNKEVKRVASEFDFKKFSRSSGDLLPEFSNFKFQGKLISVRTIETILEPLFFFIIGIVFILFGQKIGLLLLLSSIFYSLSYYIAYWRGDDIVLDLIDEIIINEAMFDVFVEGDDRTTKDGFRFTGPRPADPDLRRKTANNMNVDEEEAFEAV